MTLLSLSALHTVHLQAAAALALSLHWAAFVHVDPSPWTVIALYAAGWLAWPAYLIVVQHASIASALLATAVLSAAFTATLTLSIFAYRLFFHRLSNIPGPTVLKLSKWASVPMDGQGLRPRRMIDWHAKYGDVVRVGPREVSINDPTAVSAILGGNSVCRKGPWYLAAHGGKGERALSLHVTINQTHRRARRRIWDQAFSVRALASYEDQLHKHTHEAMSQLTKQAQKTTTSPTILDHWCMFYSFDIMGQLGFSRSFNMLRNGTLTTEIALLESFMSAVMVLGNIPYMSEVARMLPNPLQAFDDCTESALTERIKLEPADQQKLFMDTKKGAVNEKAVASESSESVAGVPDIFTHLLATDKESGWKHTWDELNADAGLTIVAGSDTSSTTLSMTLFHLIDSPDCMQRVRDELLSVFPGVAIDDIVDADALNKQCPYLNAVINEALRLHPPVASGLQRETPSTKPGVVIPLRDGKSIVLPPNTVVSLPTTALHLDERNFSPQPHAFRPQRWIDPSAERAMNKAAFIPFGFGPSGCVGRQLAYMEIRAFLAQFVLRFDVNFAKSFDKAAFLDGCRDTFTMTRHKPLLVDLRQRSTK